MTAEYTRQARLATERLDVLETLPRKGCNAKREDGRFCGRLIVSSKPGPLGMRRLCAEHVELYRAHDLMLWRIRQTGAREQERREHLRELTRISQEIEGGYR